MATPPTATSGLDYSHGQPFDTVLRGYERRQVDDFVAKSNDEIVGLKEDLAEAQRQCRLATEHAEATERELQGTSAHAEAIAVEDGFGYRAEKLLRLADQEAAEMRSHASRDSATIIEQARTEAEKHRHEVEQSLIARATVLEQQAAQRNAELQEREQQIAEQLAAAREQADQLHSAAVRTAERLRQESETAAEEAKLRAATDVQRQRDQAAQEITRLNKLHTDVRDELARLTEVLTTELAAGPRPEGAALSNAYLNDYLQPARPVANSGSANSGSANSGSANSGSADSGSPNGTNQPAR